MSRKIKYDKSYCENLWADYQKSGKKLKEYCKDKDLNYISIYTALRRNDVMNFIKKGKNKPVVTVPVQTPAVV